MLVYIVRCMLIYVVKKYIELYCMMHVDCKMHVSLYYKMHVDCNKRHVDLCCKKYVVYIAKSMYYCKVLKYGI